MSPKVNRTIAGLGFVGFVIGLGALAALAFPRSAGHPEARWVERCGDRQCSRLVLVCEPGDREPCVNIGHVVVPVQRGGR